MHLHAELRPDTRQEHRPLASMVAFGMQLAETTAEIEQRVREELESNPALERDEQRCGLCGGTGVGWCCNPGPRRASGSPPTIWYEDIEARESPAEALLLEVAPLLRPFEEVLAEEIVGNLDERGLLVEELVETAARLGVPLAQLEHVLSRLRAVRSPGLGATSPRGNLLCQLREMDTSTPGRELAELMITRMFPELAAHQYERIAGELGTTVGDVCAAVDLMVEQLDPYPAFAGSSGHRSPRTVPLAVPDIVVRGTTEGGPLRVELVEEARFQLRIARSYQASHDGCGTVEAQRVSRASRFMSQLQSRWETIRRVAETTVRKQRDFVWLGRVAIHPLTRSQVANELSVHESTVSRAVKDRRVLLPNGKTVAFADFFRPALGPLESLRRLVAEERIPQTDEVLAQALGERGHPVARRTVTKYRRELGIPSASERSTS